MMCAQPGFAILVFSCYVSTLLCSVLSFRIGFFVRTTSTYSYHPYHSTHQIFPRPLVLERTLVDGLSKKQSHIKCLSLTSIPRRSYDLQTNGLNPTLCNYKPSKRKIYPHRYSLFASESSDGDGHKDLSAVRRIYKLVFYDFLKRVLHMLNDILVNRVQRWKKYRERRKMAEGEYRMDDGAYDATLSSHENTITISLPTSVDNFSESNTVLTTDTLISVESSSVQSSIAEVTTNEPSEGFFLSPVNAEIMDSTTVNVSDEDGHENVNLESVAVEVATPLPKGPRWAISLPSVDLSGNWTIVVDDNFKLEYDRYLYNLGQPSLVRTVATSIVEMTKEEVVQKNAGRQLCIKGKNLRGVWERTLLSSGSDCDTEYEDNQHIRTQIVTADQEQVQAEAWWESDGSVHRSFLRGVKKYGGGDFESKRYLIDDGNTLVCESMFHPRDKQKQAATITWKFVRS